MVLWVLLLTGVAVVAAELVALERRRQSLLVRHRASPADELRAEHAPWHEVWRRVLPRRPIAAEVQAGETGAAVATEGQPACAPTGTAVSSPEREPRAAALANLWSTGITLLQRLTQRRPQRHAARDVLYWINVAEEVVPAPPPTRSPVAGGQSPAHDSAATPAATGTNVGAQPESHPTPNREAALPLAQARSAASLVHAATDVEDGIVYVDAAGRFTFANQAARDLLHWTSGDLALSDVLAGGAGESTTLLQAVARQELIQERVTWRAGPSSVPLDVSALALRDRDGNLWGAALFIRRPAGT